jgi:hypothetical protein
MTLPDETGPTGAGIRANPLLLQLHPDPLGPQHDKREPGFWSIRWPKGLRHVDPEAVLHSSVYASGAAARVPHFYEASAYSPDNLSDRVKFQQTKLAGSQQAAPTPVPAADPPAAGDAK